MARENWWQGSEAAVPRIVGKPTAGNSPPQRPCQAPGMLETAFEGVGPLEASIQVIGGLRQSQAFQGFTVVAQANGSDRFLVTFEVRGESLGLRV